MSEHRLRPLDPAIDMVLVGWDPRLQTFYARIVPHIDAPLGTAEVWIGTERGEIPDPAPVIATASDYAVVPEGLTGRLHAERDEAADDAHIDAANSSLTPEPTARDAGVPTLPPTTQPQPKPEERIAPGADIGSASVRSAGDVPGHGGSATAPDEGGDEVPYEVFGQEEFARRIAEMGNFDSGSARQMAGEYAELLAEFDPDAARDSVLRFDMYDVAITTAGFDWVDTSSGETLHGARDRAGRVARACGEYARDPVHDPALSASAIEQAIIWLPRSQPLAAFVDRSLDLRPVPPLLQAVKQVARGMLYLPPHPAGRLAILTALLAVASPPERHLAVDLAQAQVDLGGLDHSRSGSDSAASGRVETRVRREELHARVHELTERAKEKLSEPVRYRSSRTDPIRQQPDAPSVRTTGIDAALIKATARASNNLTDLIGPDRLAALHARTDVLHQWPRATHELLALKADAERALRVQHAPASGAAASDSHSPLQRHGAAPSARPQPRTGSLTGQAIAPDGAQYRTGPSTPARRPPPARRPELGGPAV